LSYDFGSAIGFAAGENSRCLHLEDAPQGHGPLEPETAREKRFHHRGTVRPCRKLSGISYQLLAVDYWLLALGFARPVAARQDFDL
jgi:hypothetical protein